MARLPANQVILTSIDHEAKIFYQSPPSPSHPIPDFQLLDGDIVIFRIIAETAPANMAVWEDEKLRLSVGFILVAYLGYIHQDVTRDSEIGQKIVEDWEVALANES